MGIMPRPLPRFMCGPGNEATYVGGVIEVHVVVLHVCTLYLFCRELKENVQTVPYVPDSTAPLLIRSVMRYGPVVRIKKFDPGDYSWMFTFVIYRGYRGESLVYDMMKNSKMCCLLL